MLDKLNIFSHYNIDNYYDNGFTEEGANYHYSVNPFHKDHFEDGQPMVSYTFVLSGDITSERYLKFENKFVSAFEELYNNFKILGLKTNQEKYHVIEYTDFLSFEEDLIKGLREDTFYKFIIDSLSIAIDCNFDLVIAIFGYAATDMNIILDVFIKHGLYIRNLKDVCF